MRLPNSSLYQINNSPTAHYLVQTDPAFTQYKTWLSSDYITAQVALDPTVTQKRLGDGFYEQQLIREQVANLTGQRFLADYSSDQDQYTALMNAGISYAQAYNLRPGIALSPAQIANLTTDIVWLEQQTLTLADGSTTQALVPRLYAAVRDGDLSTSGALLAGNSVRITTSGTNGDTTNSGTIAGRRLVQINSQNITNTLGTISGQNVLLTAAQDITNTGGTLVADNNLVLKAGRDITVSSTTQSSTGASGSYQFSQSGTDRVATLYTRGPGTLLASAGNNLTLTAAQIKAGGDLELEGKNITLATVQSSRSDNFNAGNADNRFLSDSSKETGTSLQSAGNTTLKAANVFTATAASIKAGGDLDVSATNIALLAGQTKANADSVMTNTSGNWISSTTTRTQSSASSATAQVNQFSGKNVTLTAGQDLVSIGTKFAATDTTNGTLTVEGKNSQSFFAAKDVSTTSKSVESSSSLLGGLIGLGSSSTTDTSSKQVSIASELQSTQAINVNVGNSASFEGANLTAKNIAFNSTNTDPTKAGQLNLNGSVDTTQTTHTSKSETLGLYQSQSGSGSTTQTLNLTKINGDVTFDKGLAVNVQLPKVVSTSGEKANTAAAANATNAVNQPSVQSQIDQLAKQPGLGYLDQLSKTAASTNPTQWSQVQLAHDKWSYQSQGLTPAGAALLSIAVAAYAPGIGSSLISSITTAAGASAAVAVNAGFVALQAQAAVAMVNNGGDIGKTLQQLGSEQSVKNLLITMATAGALDQLNSTYFADTKAPTVSGQAIDGAGSASSASSITTNGLTTTQAANQFGQNLLKNVTNNVAGAAINSAISGQPLDEKALSGALTSALLTSGLAVGANDIGSSGLNDFTKKLAHAALGCAGGAAMAGNSSGCSAGAVGAVVGEMAAEYYMGNQLDASKTFEQNIQAAKTFAKVVAAASGVIAGGGGDNVAAVNVANTTGANAVENNYFSRSPFASVRTAVAKENARLTTQCGSTCTAADFQRIDQQGAKLEQTLNLVEMAQRGKLNTMDATNLTQLIVELAPGTGTLESLAQLITGKQSLTGEETSRLWAAVGVVPFGGVLKPLGSKVGDLAALLAKDAGKAETVAVDAAKLAEKAAKSPVDIAHTIGANGGGVPSGFANANEFASFGSNVRGGLKNAGYSDVEPILQGSAVTGKSFGTGAPFDIGRVSDFDVALASPSLLQRAQDLGIGVRSGGTRTGPLSARDLEALGLTKFASEITNQAGREVNFMIYQSPGVAVQRAPSISLPGGK